MRTGRLGSKRFWSRALLSLGAAVLVVMGLAGGVFWYLLDGSLPRLDGTVATTHVGSEASIVRDNLGHVTIEASSRSDAAFATGYAHAQDRFFQMDLLRRVAAGELAALFGSQALRIDEQNRMHRFRAHAREAVQALPADQRAMLDAYAAGVNAGLASLKVRPFEYCVLRLRPQPWRPEDTMLALYAMYLDLQSGEMRQIASRGVLVQQMSPALSAFLMQPVSHWDAPLDRPVPASVQAARSDGDVPRRPVQGAAAPDQIPSTQTQTQTQATAQDADALNQPVPDTRHAALQERVAPGDLQPLPIPTERPAWLDAPVSDTRSLAQARVDDVDWHSAIGSNSFAVAGSRSESGGAALVANDMHLGLNLPNIWYRLAIHVTGADGRASLRIAGVSLPGTPLVVVGSNGDVAWGFTNSYGHYIDLVEIETDPANPARYRAPARRLAPQGAADAGAEPRRQLARRDTNAGTPAEPAPQSVDSTWQLAVPYRETIDVHGAAPVPVTVYETRWGPEWRVAGHVYAVHWVAHDPRAANTTLAEMEQAHDVASAMHVAQRSGVPTQNIVIADRSGHIGWTLAGPLPDRSAAASNDTSAEGGNAMPLPVPADRYIGWNGYLDPAAYPVRVDPAVGALWTANNRQLDSAQQWKIGDGGADVGARATQIRDDLAAHGTFDPRGLLAIQLDDRAKALAFWRDVMLEALDAQALDGHPQRQTLRALVAQWDARAGVDSVGYTLVRDFQSEMYSGWFGALDARMSGLYAGSGYRAATSRSLAIMETLARAHAWVPHRFPTWQAFVLNRIDTVIVRDTANGAVLDNARWGDRNRAAIAHPFARLMPALIAAHLMAPPDPLPGDINMPRVQGRNVGASERMDVAPGHEDQGILEMPGGASGHPLSPFFLAGHEDWVHGNPSAFLPGPEAHRLRLVPSAPRS